MPSQHPEEIGYGHVIESYVTRTYGGLPRYLVLNGGRLLGPRWRHTNRFTRHLLNDAAAITDEELEALLGTHHADRFAEPDGLWDEWTKDVGHLGYPSYTPAEQHRWTDLHCDFANGWTRP
ncbi:DUF6000 family protein [Streptomyces sp. TRM68416]|uniref:DUF6000 family protein n=1 Tax=Streptomyces sp. TRM68416 TaxID=2758412 RepID=UPI001661B8B9|nr:DUF6000 family protein [Streptomyces sp. TRM68416]MBD0843042.1 hypothetical protein [Streptomyces sp. TRM68416]